jgi:hypothetical protein
MPAGAEFRKLAHGVTPAGYSAPQTHWMEAGVVSKDETGFGADVASVDEVANRILPAIADGLRGPVAVITSHEAKPLTLGSLFGVSQFSGTPFGR